MCSLKIFIVCFLQIVNVISNEILDSQFQIVDSLTLNKYLAPFKKRISDLQNLNKTELINGPIPSEHCANDLLRFFSNLQNSTGDDIWALKMIDATAKIPAGILSLNLGGTLGDFNECIGTHSKKYAVKGNYCLATILLDLSRIIDSLQQNNKPLSEKAYNFQAAYPSTYPSFALCIPNHCHESDLQQFLQWLDLPLQLYNVSVTFQCQNEDQVNPSLSVGAWCTICFFIVYILIMVLSTLYDFYSKTTGSEPYYPLLTAFSIYTNWKKLFKISQRNANQLTCLHGIKVLSMMWIVFGHCFSLLSFSPLTNSKDVLIFLSKTESMLFSNAVHSVDTFFMISGLLMVYTFIKSQRSMGKFNLLAFYLHRYIRLTVPLFPVILVSATLINYMGSGPRWPFMIGFFQGFCQKYWWSTLLYIQNYVNTTTICIGQTWYLDVEFQLYLLAPIFLITLVKHPKITLSLLFVVLVIFLIVPFCVTWYYELPALSSNLYADLVNFQTKYYLMTHTRASSWFVGVIIGYFIAQDHPQTTDKTLMKRIRYLLIANTATIIMQVLIFGFHEQLSSKEYHKFINAIYNGIARPLWAACMGLIVYICSRGYGGPLNTFLSLPIFEILSRFTYSIYLLHVTLLYMIIFATKTPKYFSIFNVAYSFWGITIYTFCLSVLWVLAFESPAIVIEKYLLSKHK